jgi:hypothetical protein
MPPKKNSARKPPYPARLFVMAMVFAVSGWGGVAGVVFFTFPFLLPRFIFFFSLFLAFAGTALPFVWYLNRRFTGERFPSEGVLVREALELASLGVFLIWLQAGRMFTAFLGWVFFGVFLAVELLLRVFENSRWSPGSPAEEEPQPAEPTSPNDIFPPE